MKNLNRLILGFIFILSFFCAGCKKDKAITEGAEDAAEESGSPVSNYFYCGVSAGEASVPVCYFYDKNVCDEDWKYSPLFYKSRQTMLADLLKGKIQAAVFSFDEAIEINRKYSESVKLLGILQKNNGGVITSSPDLSGIEAFSGITVYGGKPDSRNIKLLNKIIEKENCGSPVLDFSENTHSLVNAFVTGRADNVFCGEPLKTMIFNKAVNANTGFTLSQYYEKYSGGKIIPEAVILVNSSFGVSNKQQTGFFELEMAKAVKWCQSDFMKAAALAVQNKIIPEVKTGRDLCKSGIYMWLNDFDGRSHIEGLLKFCDEEIPAEGFYISTPASL